MGLHITTWQIIFRILFVAVIAGLIGWDRQKKNRPAGVQVHILVAIGATIAALIQRELTLQAMKFATDNPNVADFVANDAARLLAAVVSGIGFLGAGTIVVTKQIVRGLSTAASLWATASLGLAVGLGYYQIAIIGGIGILGALILVERGLRIDIGTDIEITLNHENKDPDIIEEFFRENHIKFIPKDYKVSKNPTQKDNLYIVNYSIKRPNHLDYATLSERVLKIPGVTQIELTSY